MGGVKRWIQRALIVISFAVLLALPGQALALSIAPPGKSGADQYFETIPTSSGNAAPPGTVPGSSGPGSHALTQLGHGAAGAAALARLGTEGSAAAALAAATAPTPVPRALVPRTRSGGSTRRAPAPGGGSAPSGLTQALTGSDSGGLGLVLPLLLATSLIAAIAVVAARLRRRAQPPELGA